MWLLQRGWEEKLMMRDGLSMRNQALIYPFTSSVEPSPPLSASSLSGHEDRPVYHGTAVLLRSIEIENEYCSEHPSSREASRVKFIRGKRKLTLIKQHHPPSSGSCFQSVSQQSACSFRGRSTLAFRHWLEIVCSWS